MARSSIQAYLTINIAVNPPRGGKLKFWEMWLLDGFAPAALVNRFLTVTIEIQQIDFFEGDSSEVNTRSQIVSAVPESWMWLWQKSNDLTRWMQI